MRCGRSRDLISEAFDVDLPEHQRQELLEHLSDCDDCRRHHEILERGRTLLHEGLVDAPETLEWNVQLGIQRALRERAQAPAPGLGRSFWGRTVASAAAAAAVVVLVGGVLLSDRGVDPVAESAAPSSVAQREPAAEPDLSGARPVTDIEFGNAFSGDYGIRTVADQSTLGSLNRNYPMSGRRFHRSTTASPEWEQGSVYRLEGRIPTGSQVLHLRIVPPKLRREPSSGTAAADSQVASPESRR